MQHLTDAIPQSSRREPWNKGKLVGAKPPLRPKHVWSIRTKLQIAGRTRDLAMFNLAIDSKLRGCDVAWAPWLPNRLPRCVLGRSYRRPVADASCIDRAERREGRLQPLDIRLGHFLQIDEGIARHLVDPDQLVEFQLHRLRVAALRVLDNENHQEGDDSCSGVDDKLPSIGPAE